MRARRPADLGFLLCKFFLGDEVDPATLPAGPLLGAKIAPPEPPEPVNPRPAGRNHQALFLQAMIQKESKKAANKTMPEQRELFGRGATN